MTNFSLTSSKFSGSSLRIFTVLFIQVCVEHGNMRSIFSIFCLEQIKSKRNFSFMIRTSFRNQTDVQLQYI